MRIAYISNNNPRDINNWSGTPYHIISALSKYHEVDWVVALYMELCGITVF